MRGPRFFFALLLSSFAIIAGSSVQAQISSDQTLGAEESIVKTSVDASGNSAVLIEGGATRGPNLFHSFEAFSVDENASAYFANPNNVSSIFSRVTQSAPSNILGTLGVNGPADLYFINPNGIVFGEHAKLDLQGSFYATTADEIRSQGTDLFSSALTSDSSQLLAVRPSAFFFSRTNQGSDVVVRTSARASSQNRDRGLQVNDGEDITIVSNDVDINGGLINAWDGSVQIAAVAGEASVDLSDTGVLTIPDRVQRGNIDIQNRALVDVEFITDGNIRLLADDINILSG
ncbi:MAG: filamentous hemagglutinin N-terminal domain-containing protein, partial [Cyanobacteria bacterium J06560_2]